MENNALQIVEKLVWKLAICYSKLTVFEANSSIRGVAKEMVSLGDAQKSEFSSLLSEVSSIIKYNLGLASEDIISQTLLESSYTKQEDIYKDIIHRWTRVESFLRNNHQGNLAIVACILREIDESRYYFASGKYTKTLAHLKLAEEKTKQLNEKDLAFNLALRITKNKAQCYEATNQWRKAAECWMKLYCFVTYQSLATFMLEHYYNAITHTHNTIDDGNRRLEKILQNNIRYSMYPIDLYYRYKNTIYTGSTKLYVSVYLTPEYWEKLFDTALNKFTKRQLAAFLKYGEQVNVHFIKKRLIERKCGLPILRLRILCELSDTTLDEAEQYVTKIRPRSKQASEHYELA